MPRGKTQPDEKLANLFRENMGGLVKKGDFTKLGDKVGKSGEMIKNYAKKGALPSADTFYKIAKVLDRPMEWFFSTPQEQNVLNRSGTARKQYKNILEMVYDILLSDNERFSSTLRSHILNLHHTMTEESKKAEGKEDPLKKHRKGRS